MSFSTITMNNKGVNMANIKAFRAIRPTKGLEQKIAALPYDVYNRREAKNEVSKEPDTFLKVDRAETLFPDDYNMYSDEVYQKAKEVFWNMVSEKKFVMEESDAYYVYELTMNKRSQTGIVGCASVEDYINNVIKKHENTRADKEIDRIKHVDVLEAQTGPIFLAYRSREEINEVVNKKKLEEPLYDFVASDRIRHRVWVIDSKDQIEIIQNTFTDVRDIYIADGHHRCASAVKVALKRREEDKNLSIKDESQFFLSVLFPDDQLMIMDYNRVVKDLNGLDIETFLLQIQEHFIVENRHMDAYSPTAKYHFGMYIDNTWYKLSAKQSIRNQHPVDGLDVSILQNYLLAPILGITDPKTDQRIDFVGGIRGLMELEKRVETDCVVAFSMHPTSIGELFDVSDAGLLMPPKSTWFEPKLRSGLFIHSIRKDEQS